MEKAKASKLKKMEEMKAKMKSAMSKLSVKVEKEEENNPETSVTEEEEALCIICREGREKECLYYSALLQPSNQFQPFSQNEPNKPIYIFSSCYHILHASCFKEACKDRSMMFCSFCKSPMNVILPAVLPKKKSEERWE